MSSAPRTWGERLVQARLRLGRAGIEEAETKLRWLQAHILQCGLLDGLRYHADIPAPGEAFAFEAGVSRLEKDEPVQYILGETDFMGLRIFCDSRALIPRPETELLVQCAQDCAKAVPPPCRMVDVGTGTGCIACALAKRLPGAQVTAVDISPDALALARLNANALGVNIRLVQSDWLAAVEDNSVDLVVSNPPYISEQECDGLDRTVRDFEPRLALSGGGTGMEAISRLVQEASRVLISGGWLLMEIGDDQAEAVTELLCPTHPTIQLNNLKFDYAGRARIVMARRRSR